MIYSKGLDPHGDNVIYAYGDASLRIPRPQGCRIVMMNGAAISFVFKMQTTTAPSSTAAETVTLFDCSTDVMGLRNLLEELGHLQEFPTTIYQDNRSTIQIANNRGSLGRNSRAMDLKTLTIRNRIEDHAVEAEWLETKAMLTDMGCKALPENRFTRFRDSMNGYLLVRTRFPHKEISPYIYNPDNGSSTLEEVQAGIMSFTFHSCNDDSVEYEEEEQEDDVDYNSDAEMVEEIKVGEDKNDDGYEVEALPSPPMIPVISHDTILFVPVDVAIDEEVVNNEDIVLNDNVFEFDHQWQLHRMYLHIQSELFELVILPDPRLYGINVQRLRDLARNLCSKCGSSFEANYENYMLHIETMNMKMEMMDHYLVHLNEVVENQTHFAESGYVFPSYVEPCQQRRSKA